MGEGNKELLKYKSVWINIINIYINYINIIDNKIDCAYLQVKNLGL